MSGGVFNVTVENCLFGSNGSDYAGIHIKTKRGRGGAVHSIVFRNIIVDSRAVTRQLPILSASMFYSGSVAPTNVTATPHIYDVSFTNVTGYMPKSSKPGYALQFIGLAEQAMERFTFTDIAITGLNAGWQCTDTTGFEFSGTIIPPPPVECRK